MIADEMDYLLAMSYRPDGESTALLSEWRYFYYCLNTEFHTLP